MAKWTEKKDIAYDKAHGIKEGSKKDQRLDKARGLPPDVASKGTAKKGVGAGNSRGGSGHGMGCGCANCRSSRPGAGADKNWIAGATKNKGGLHRSLGIPAGQKIPAAKVAAAAQKGGRVGKQARLAQTLKGLG